MILPPVLLRVRARKPGKRRLGCWVPLLLLWPLLLALALLASCGAVVRALIRLRWRETGRALLLGPQLLALLCSTRRLRIDAREAGAEFFLAID
ncbi:MAG: hypothetical protein ACC662_00110 [Planctomycetota bacterium]